MVILKRKIKNKIFHDKRCQKICRTRNRYKSKATTPINFSIASKKLVVHAPARMSIFEDTNSTLQFFDDITQKIKACAIRQTLYFDLSNVEYITPDVVMYLIAIINNTKRLRMLDISCEGNMPINQQARLVFEDAGFFKFVYSKYSRTISDSSQFRKIENGSTADNQLAGSFCNFVHSCCNKTYVDTKRLYPMIIELMTNTHQHAYHSKEDDDTLEMYTNWYIFAQDIGASVRFVFLDTGSGIPKTVSKRLREAFKDVFTAKNDAVYLESVLKGDYVRSETGLVHRGKGLPGIYEDCQNEYIKNFKIISGKAKCHVDKAASIVTESIPYAFEGTLFTWDIEK